MMTKHTLHLHLVSEVQLSYKTKDKASDRPKISCPEDAYKILSSHWDLNTIEFVEEFKILLLNRANRVFGIVPISKGGVSATVVDPKLIFVAAIKANASGIIMAHNHPSGNLQASDSDKRLTYNCQQAGKYLEVPVLDHIIITKECFLSFSEAGLL